MTEPKNLSLTSVLEIQAGADGGDGQPALPRFTMVAHTGGVMRVGGWRHPVVVNLAWLAIPSQSRPIRFGHDANSGVPREQMLPDRQRTQLTTNNRVATVASRPAGTASRTGRRSRADGGARPGEVGQHVPVAGLPPRRGTDADRSAPGGRGLQARDRRRRQAQGGGLEHDAVQGPGHPGQPPAHVHLEAPPRRDARPLLVRAQREPDSRACLPQAGSRT